MSALPALLEAFHDAILTGEAARAVPDIRPNLRLAPEEQLTLYIEGYRVRLMQAIRADYPALLALLGEAEFERLARDYIEANPPTHFNLDRYPHGFAAFIRPEVDAFAADVAALEGAIAEVFMAEESAPLDPSALADLTPETFGAMTLAPRAASRLLRLDYPAEAYMVALRGGNAPARPEPEREYLCLVRHRNEVKRHKLGEAEYRLLAGLFAGEPIGAALQPDMAEQVQGWFGRWFGEGFFKEV